MEPGEAEAGPRAAGAAAGRRGRGAEARGGGVGRRGARLYSVIYPKNQSGEK